MRHKNTPQKHARHTLRYAPHCAHPTGSTSPKHTKKKLAPRHPNPLFPVLSYMHTHIQSERTRCPACTGRCGGTRHFPTHRHAPTQTHESCNAKTCNKAQATHNSPAVPPYTQQTCTPRRLNPHFLASSDNMYEYIFVLNTHPVGVQHLGEGAVVHVFSNTHRHTSTYTKNTPYKKCNKTHAMHTLCKPLRRHHHTHRNMPPTAAKPVVGCLRFTKLCWVGKHILRSKYYYETDELPNPRPTQHPKKRLKVAFGTFFPTANNFRGLGLTLFRKQITGNPTQPNSPQTPY